MSSEKLALQNFERIKKILECCVRMDLLGALSQVNRHWLEIEDFFLKPPVVQFARRLGDDGVVIVPAAMKYESGKKIYLLSRGAFKIVRLEFQPEKGSPLHFNYPTEQLVTYSNVFAVWSDDACGGDAACKEPLLVEVQKHLKSTESQSGDLYLVGKGVLGTFKKHIASMQ